MAEHDYVVDNAAGSAVRSDINSFLSAIVSKNSKTRMARTRTDKTSNSKVKPRMVSKASKGNNLIPNRASSWIIKN